MNKFCLVLDLIFFFFYQKLAWVSGLPKVLGERRSEMDTHANQKLTL